VNGSAGKIEILKPFGDAFELTKKILFQPFNFEKWLVIGFAAFLTHLNGGGFNFPINRNWNATQSQQENLRSFFDQLTPVWIALIGLGLLLALAVVFVLMWIKARGHFIFIDCIVHDRGAIVQPWKEYRAEGNSYFIFLVCFFLCFVVAILAIVFIVVVPIFIINPSKHGAFAFLPLASLILILPLFLIFVSLTQFVAPVMYRRRCRVWPAIVDLLSLVGENLGIFILYVLFGFLLGLGVATAMATLMCLTCCIAAIPYVGTVILLPIYVFVQAFSLFFIKQFGPDYDVWGALPQSAVPPPAPPLPS
jgi:hypothetical protein